MLVGDEEADVLRQQAGRKDRHHNDHHFHYLSPQQTSVFVLTDYYIITKYYTYDCLVKVTCTFETLSQRAVGQQQLPGKAKCTIHIVYV